ncbi:hypothetical protein A6A40_19125 (plasmid) [Azospirillum humicireducens]|uniref:Uncharacterized protein n=1 Tax=Azospirillum humicireducens TaxID=1226968 RepID=A0A2R4VS05_9PROT|nr:hypothetical protein [Azospirillum humicireducens]AWB07181.1 hypothetical protein A6A40_19125 [Azospirillum humicireducens]
MAQVDPQPAAIPLPALAVTASKQGPTIFDTPASAWLVDERTLDEGRLQGLDESYRERADTTVPRLR